MKLLTTNFLTCAVKACKSSPSSFPLHFKDAVLERSEIAYNPLFITNILPRLNWDALRTTATELGLGAALPVENPSEQAGWTGKNTTTTTPLDSNGAEQDAADAAEQGAMDVDNGAGAGDGKEVPSSAAAAPADGDNVAKDEVLKKLHALLLETAVSEGKLVCGNCGFEYPIKDGVGNFLLPAHLV